MAERNNDGSLTGEDGTRYWPNTRPTAYEQVQPYCGCGFALPRPDGFSTPSERAVVVECSCGRGSAAQFWRRQSILLYVEGAWMKSS